MSKFKLPHGWNKIQVWLIVAFIVVGIIAANQAWSNDGYFSLGYQTINQEGMVGQVGIRYNDFAFNYQRLGETDTNILSISKEVRPDWCLGSACYYMRIGGAYVFNHPDVGNLNYQLGIALDFGVWELEWYHYSSAGINRINRGLDGVLLRFAFPFN